MSDRSAANQVIEGLKAEVARLPRGRTLRPRVLAHQAGIEAWQALAILRLLEEAGLGQVRVQVLDPTREGIPLVSYRSHLDIPAELENDFGDRFEVQPEHLALVFVPTQSLENNER